MVAPQEIFVEPFLFIRLCYGVILNKIMSLKFFISPPYEKTDSIQGKLALLCPENQRKLVETHSLIQV